MKYLLIIWQLLFHISSFGQTVVSDITNIEIPLSNIDGNSINGAVIQVGNEFVSYTTDNRAIYFHIIGKDIEVKRVELELSCLADVTPEIDQVIVGGEKSLYLWYQNRVQEIDIVTGEYVIHEFDLEILHNVLIRNEAIVGIQHNVNEDDFGTHIEIRSMDQELLFSDYFSAESIFWRKEKLFIHNSSQQFTTKIDEFSFIDFQRQNIYIGDSISYIRSYHDDVFYQTKDNELLKLNVSESSISKICDLEDIEFISFILESENYLLIQSPLLGVNTSYKLNKNTCELKPLAESMAAINIWYSTPIVYEKDDHVYVAHLTDFDLNTYNTLSGITTSYNCRECFGLTLVNEHYYALDDEYVQVHSLELDLSGNVLSRVTNENIYNINNLNQRGVFNDSLMTFYFPSLDRWAGLSTYEINTNGDLISLTPLFKNLNQGTASSIDWFNYGEEYFSKIGNKLYTLKSGGLEQLTTFDYIHTPYVDNNVVVGFTGSLETPVLTFYDRNNGSTMMKEFTAVKFSIISVVNIYHGTFGTILESDGVNYKLDINTGEVNEIEGMGVSEPIGEINGRFFYFGNYFEDIRNIYTYNGEAVQLYRELDADFRQSLQKSNSYNSTNPNRVVYARRLFNDKSYVLVIDAVKNTIEFEMVTEGNVDVISKNYRGEHIINFENTDTLMKHIVINREQVQVLEFPQMNINPYSYKLIDIIDSTAFIDVYAKGLSVQKANQEVFDTGILSKESIRDIVKIDSFFYVWSLSDQLNIYKISTDLTSSEEIWKTNTFSCNKGIDNEIYGVDSLGNILFAPYTNEIGNELWQLESKTGEIKLVKDFFPGVKSGVGKFQLFYNGYVYFTALEEGENYQLWKHRTSKILSNTTQELNEEIEAYPNPTSDVVNIDTPFDRYYIYNSKGQLVLKGKMTPQINLGEQINGVYVLVLISKSNYLTSIIVKI